MASNSIKISAYDALYDSVLRLANKHPRSYVVMDAQTHELIDSGVDFNRVLTRVGKKLRPGQVPVIYKKEREGEILVY